MLDNNILEQLTSVFGKLEKTVELVYSESAHADQKDLVQLLEQVASTSKNIIVKPAVGDHKAPFPQFHIEYEGRANGMYFKGIPNGHEFTSLILAILNSDGKGKFPDEKVSQRIKRLKGPVEIKTFISLTCENCPDVVQTLNQMAVIHGNFKHTMVDGAYTQDEIAALGVQGVPSVMVNDKLTYSGRLNVIDLITALEKAFGTEEPTHAKVVDHNLGTYDVVVIGGGPAGSAAAIYSARKGLKTALLAERFGGQVQDTKGIENLIGVKYTEGPQLAAQLSQHIDEYPVTKFEHRRVENIIDGNEKLIKLEGGEYIHAKAIIVTTGAKWRELNIPGEKDYIGRGVAFCPHCDGPYYKGKKIAVVGGGNSGVEAAIDLAGIVKEVILFEFMDTLKADKVLVDKLKSLPNVSIVTEARTAQVIGDGTKVVSLEYENRKTKEMMKVDLDGIFVQIGLLPNSGFVKDIVETTKFGEIVVDVKGRTNVKGIYAAGDVTTTPYKQIIIAMGEGAKAALAAFEDQMLQ
ncbi:MAG: alkyl hydroperoxide reductase subunit F [Rhizobacter sp.]|nr:alkyl hydroperoxide reductase subunit F [Bacteriovorax sp.]